jgi:flagellar biosynthesis protein FliR
VNSLLQDIVTHQILTFILIFVRIGTAIMIMPGVGDSFVSERIRLHMALGLTLVMTPAMMPFMPSVIPPTLSLLVLIASEFVTGLFFGTISRILVMALDTAGMLISTQAGLSNAQLFNPALASQGSLVGAFLTVTGVLLLMVTGMHHLLFMGLKESYTLFPVGNLPEPGDMSEMMGRAVSASFLLGFQLAMPFIILTTMMYIGMGVLARLMPQIQIFMIATPLQIMLSLMMLSMTVSAIALFWLGKFEDGMVYFLSVPG